MMRYVEVATKHTIDMDVGAKEQHRNAREVAEGERRDQVAAAQHPGHSWANPGPGL